MKKMILLLLLFPSLTLAAESTINCHCFQDRTYNHQDRTAADPYFLASSQSSLLSAIYNVEKRSLVMAKMSGSTNDYLWILHDLVQKTGQPENQIAAIQSREKSWENTFQRLGQTPDSLGQTYWKLSTNPQQLADSIVDEHLVKIFKISREEIRQWRKLGMNRKEIIIANILEGLPNDLYHLVNSGMKSWSQLLDEQGLANGKAVTEKLKKQMSASLS
jgi:hypothetical protein